MADTIRRVSYYYTTIPDKPGEGRRLLDALRSAGVNLLALHAFPSARKAQVDFEQERRARTSREYVSAQLRGPEHPGRTSRGLRRSPARSYGRARFRSLPPPARAGRAVPRRPPVRAATGPRPAGGRACVGRPA